MKLYAIRCKKTDKWLRPSYPHTHQFEKPGFWTRPCDIASKMKAVDKSYRQRYVRADFEVVEFELDLTRGRIV